MEAFVNVLEILKYLALPQLAVSSCAWWYPPLVDYWRNLREQQSNHHHSRYWGKSYFFCFVGRFYLTL